jgi:hypothetical protein
MNSVLLLVIENTQSFQVFDDDGESDIFLKVVANGLRAIGRYDEIVI